MKHLPLFQAITTLVGTIIGAGILAVPYVFMKAGFLTGTAMLVVVAAAMILLSLMFGEITLRTAGRHQITGYVGKYLGKNAEKVVAVFLMLAITGSLLAYFIGLGDVLAAIFGGSALFWGLLFYLFSAGFIFFGIRLIKSLEFILTLGLFLAVFAILFHSFNHFTFSEFDKFDLAKFFLPYGVLLFACTDLVSIPEAREILAGKEKFLKKAIFWGSFIPALTYLLFALAVVGVCGWFTTPIATLGLGLVLGKTIVVIVNVFAAFAIFTSLLTLGLALKEMYDYDFKLHHTWAWLLTIVVPLVFYFLGLRNFIEIISLASALGFGINGVIYVWTYWQARKKGERQPEYVLSKSVALPASIFLCLIFLIGLGFVLVDIIK